MDEGETFTLNAIGENKIVLSNVTWISSNTSVLTVNNGEVTAVGEGTAKITANSLDNAMASITFKVNGNKTDKTTNLQYIDNGDETCKIVGYSGTDKVLVIPDTISGLKVTELADKAFENCSNLLRIEIPSSVTSGGDNIFTGCTSLRTVYGPYGNDTIGGTVLVAMSNLCTELGFENFENGGFDYLMYTDLGETCSITTGITSSTCMAIPSSICGKRVIEIENNCFGALNQEETVVKIPDSVTKVGSKAFGSKVYRVIWLTEKSSSELNVATDAFDENIKVICLLNKGLYNLLNTDSYNVNLVSTIIYNNTPLLVGDGNATLFGWQESKWESVPECDCSGANGDRTRIYHLAFANNKFITKIDVSGWTNLTSIGNGAFMNCSSLGTINLPANITTIGNRAFYNCSSLNKLMLSDKVTSIGKYAFDGMNGTVYYPSSIKSLIDAYEGSFNNFVEIKLENVIVKTLPTKINYYVGDNLDTSGLKLVATYNSGAKSTITSGFTCTPTKLEEAGIQAITLTYEGKKLTFDVIVEGVELSSIAITKEPTKKEYIEGENFNPEGMEVTATYNNGSSKVLTASDYTITDGNNLTAGKTSITISYTEGSVTETVEQTITVDKTAPIALSNIKVTTEPDKKEYYKGDSLDTKGMVVTANYTNSSTKNVTEEVTCTPEKLETVGEQTITVTYLGETDTFNVTVREVELSSIAITKEPIKKEYIEGENFNSEGMVVTATYSDGSKQEVNDGLVMGGLNLQEGQTSVLISYTEGGITKTATQTITVVAKELSGIEITGAPKTSYIEGETFDPAGMVVTAKYNNGSTKVVTNYTVTPREALTTSNNKVTISYTENNVTKTAELSITVVAKVSEEDILKDDSEYKVEKDDGVLYITDIMPKTAINKFKEQLKTGYEIELYDINENKITDNNEYVKTNTKMIAKKDGRTIGEYILVVIGDCNGSGTTNVSDLTKLMISRAESLAQNKDESKILKGAYEKAVDLNKDGKVNSIDITKLLMFIAENK